jgi:hypothetical protein
VTWVSHAYALNPVHVHAARLAVENPGCEFPFQIALHPQQLQPDLLGGDGDGVIGGQASVHRLVDDPIGIRGLLSDGVDGVLEDVVLAT